MNQVDAIARAMSDADWDVATWSTDDREEHDTLQRNVDVADRHRLIEAIVEEVAKQVGIIAQEAHTELHASMDRVMDKIEHDWRAKLGIDA